MARKSNNRKSGPILRRVAKKPEAQELGFGKHVTTVGRMMNPDGTFNVIRDSTHRFSNAYYHLVTMSWGRFLLYGFLVYIGLNLLFALLYWMIGVDQLSGLQTGNTWQTLVALFSFSAQTLTTVGYGAISPQGIGASLLSSFEAFCGLLAFAFMSGLLYGRFSRPRARIIFSEKLLISPYRGGKGIMFRMMNAQRSELLETEVKLMLALNQKDEKGGINRQFYYLDLERERISFFSLSWTVVHPLDENSPLYGFTKEEIINCNTEFLVLVKGIDEANNQTVHARRSYTTEEMVWDAKFQPMITRSGPLDLPRVWPRHIGTFEKVKQEEFVLKD